MLAAGCSGWKSKNRKEVAYASFQALQAQIGQKRGGPEPPSSFLADSSFQHISLVFPGKSKVLVDGQTTLLTHLVGVDIIHFRFTGAGVKMRGFEFLVVGDTGATLMCQATKNIHQVGVDVVVFVVSHIMESMENFQRGPTNERMGGKAFPLNTIVSVDQEDSIRGGQTFHDGIEVFGFHNKIIPTQKDNIAVGRPEALVEHKAHTIPRILNYGDIIRFIPIIHLVVSKTLICTGKERIIIVQPHDELHTTGRAEARKDAVNQTLEIFRATPGRYKNRNHGYPISKGVVSRSKSA